MYTVGVIGAGTILAHHREAFDRLRHELQLTAVCDLKREAALTAASGFDATVWTDYREMLTQARPDICLVALPHFLHLPVGRAVLEAGSHLFMEKPLAMNVAECRELIELAERRRLTVMVGHTHQYSPPLMKAKELIQSGVIGELKFISDNIYAYYNWEKRAPWFLNREQAGAGCIMNTTPHQLDHLLYLTEVPASSVYAKTWCNRPEGNVESDFCAMITFADGTTAQVSTLQGWHPGGDATVECRVIGTRGALVLNPFQNSVRLCRDNTFETIELEQEWSRIPLEWKELLEALKNVYAPRTDGYYGLEAVRLIEAICDSSASGQVINL